MKTKIRSIIIICTLGLVGVLNVNATSSYNTSCVSGTLDGEKNVKFENLNSAGFDFNAETEIDFQKEAQLVTKWIADNEEAKTIQMLIDKGLFVSNEEMGSFTDEAKSESLSSTEFDFNAEAETDYQKEAQEVTKWIADNEEAKTIQMLIDRGLLVENK